MELHARASSNVTQNNHMNTLGLTAKSEFKYKQDNYTNYYVSNHLKKLRVT